MKALALLIALTLSATAQDKAVTVGQDNGVWWFRAPTGARFISIGANHVEPLYWQSPRNAEFVRETYGGEKPANHCVFNRLRFESCGSTNPADWRKLHLWLMSMRGRGNTVSNSTFRGFNHIGQMIGAAELPKDRPQQLHVLNNRFIDRPKIDDQNGYEILQIVWSGEKAATSVSLIAGNTFEDCDGENEIVSLKASDVVGRKKSVPRLPGRAFAAFGEPRACAGQCFRRTGAGERRRHHA